MYEKNVIASTDVSVNFRYAALDQKYFTQWYAVMGIFTFKSSYTTIVNYWKSSY